MVQSHHSPPPANNDSSFFCGLLGKDTASEFIPGRTRHLGLMEPPSNPTSVIPSNIHTLDLQQQPKWAPQSQGIDASTSSSSILTTTHPSTATRPSTATSRFGFDRVNEVCNTRDQSSSRDLPPGVPTGPAADRNRINRPNSLLGHFDTKGNHPPSNAPTGPAVQRKRASRLDTAHGLQQSTRPAECASWSQSLTWQSEGARAREAFRRVSAEMRHLGIDKSPVAPKGVEEYLNTKMHNVQRALARQKREQQKATEQLRQLKSEEGETYSTQQVKSRAALHNSLSSNKLSPLFGADLCWNAHYTAMDDVPHDERVEWPPLAAFKEAGRRIGFKAPHRSLPLPRQNQIQDRMRVIEGDGASDEGGTTGYYQQVLKLDRLALSPLHSPEEPDAGDACDVDANNLTAWTREIIHDIECDEEENETIHQAGNEDEKKKDVVEQKGN